MLPTSCPKCSGALEVQVLRCTQCGTRVEGEFAFSPLLLLNAEDRKFVLDFVLCSGSLKQMASQYSLSYPTIRNRLNAIIEILNHTPDQIEQKKIEILDQVSRGELDAQSAAKLLQELA